MSKAIKVHKTQVCLSVSVYECVCVPVSVYMSVEYQGCHNDDQCPYEWYLYAV